MRRRTPGLDRFESDRIRSEPPDSAAARRIFEGLWQEAVTLGVLPCRDLLDGIDVKIRLARALHVREAARKNRPGA